MEINISINGVKTDAKPIGESTAMDALASSDGGAAVAAKSNGYSHHEDENPAMLDIGPPPEWLLEGIKNSAAPLAADNSDGDIEDAGSGPSE